MQKKNAKILIFSALVFRNLCFLIIYLNFFQFVLIFTFSLRLTFFFFNFKKGFNESKYLYKTVSLKRRQLKELPQQSKIMLEKRITKFQYIYW